MKPQQLAKILKTMTTANPGDYGLFWDKDGTMPWKELFWALQREENLRFVRESHIREIELSGAELPFRLEEGRLKLKIAPPLYPEVSPPKHLFFTVPLKGIPFVKSKGISVPSHRSFIPLWNDPEEGLKRAKPSYDDTYIVVTVNTEVLPNHHFYQAGDKLFLTDLPIPPKALLIPPISEKALEEVREARREKIVKQSQPRDETKLYGSFALTVEAFLKEVGDVRDESSKKSQKKQKSKGPDWKRESRRIRKTKRSI
ncbi:MAG: hypothetical protein N2260_00095 [Syntrophobacterales bacterium]|nr:hypothetical protein [Syntrophobacterales bacterium]